uniref:Uncharacterized protein n=1 Tax=Lepeophtheirus salmonis TaxID=72036 RepID=A0A0K2UJV3_LEPSM
MFLLKILSFCVLFVGRVLCKEESWNLGDIGKENEGSVSLKSPFIKDWTLPDTGDDPSLTYALDLSFAVSDEDPGRQIHFSIMDGDEVLSATLPHYDNVSVLLASNTSLEQRVTLFLCPTPGDDRYVTFSARTRYPSAIPFKFKIRVISLDLPLGQTQIMDVSTGLPVTLRINPSASYRDYFVLNVDSVDFNTKDVCIVVAASEGKCPMKNSPETVVTSDAWQTALKSASITIRARTFSFIEPFFVTVVVMPNDYPCSLGSSVVHDYDDLSRVRTKKISIVVHKGDGYLSYMLPIFASLGFLIFIVLISCLIVGTKDYKTYDEADFVGEPEEATSVMGIRSSEETPQFEVDEDERAYTLYRDCFSAMEERKSTAPNRAIRIERGMKRFKHRPRISDLSMISATDNWFRRNRSRVYIYLLPLITLFYFIPAIQFVFLAKAQEENTGSQDICYHNFRCSKPFSIFTDFNHIVSNSSYFIYGMSFMVLVAIKKSKLSSSLNDYYNKMGGTGIPQQLSIFHALGFALMAQGLFSICYHVCPTNLSLQFDTTMMYIICVLSIIKIYQFRHPDATANAYSTFGFVGFLVLLEALALYTSSWLVYFPFFLLYVVTTLFIAIDSYFMGLGRIDRIIGRLLFKHIFFECFCSNSERCSKGPLFLLRFIWGILFSIANITYALYTAVSKYKDPKKSLSHVVLFILAANLLAYLLYYIIRKIVKQNFTDSARFNPLHVFVICGKTYKCRFPTGTFFGSLAILFGGLGFYLYSSRSANRNLSPAESRNLNSHCTWFDFYDNHDIWHFFGATGVYTAFISLLTIDDDLLYTNRNEIDVF